ncbi:MULTISPECIES: MGMT family protein [unclassified Haladaptatus]|uniref:MGMT family protein n=1 Tax=unclassified Haladaptatus TaxID=2622732 RepID=UPI0023E8FB6E|nr:MULTISPECIES: MGMT family protein [unclassified Haladaptatus]
MDESAGIYARESDYLDRFVQIGVASGRVISVSFPDKAPADANPDHPVLDRIFAYLEGVQESFDTVDVALTVPTAHRRVLDTVRQIPYGQQYTVERIARMTPELDPQDDADLTLVRTALDENPTPILIPDHRVRDGPSAAPPEIEQKLRSLEGL